MTQARLPRIGWRDLGEADALDGRMVEVTGFPSPPPGAASARSFALLAEPPCCPGCAPRDRLGAIEIAGRMAMPMRAGALSLRGVWRVNPEPGGWRYTLGDAIPTEPPGWQAVGRRAVLAAGPIMCLAASAHPASAAEAMAVLNSGAAMDLHSHAGGIAGLKRIRDGVGFGPVAAPMRTGRMAAIAWAVVSDSPVHKTENGRIRPYRDPAPGELYDHTQLAFSRVQALIKSEGLGVIANRAGIAAARAGVPHVVVASEGADFLEGKIDRVDEAFARWTLRHLQLTHYRVNELGDIQTEPPVHNGLTSFGAEVVRRCNKLGIVVDLAHATLPMVRRAADVTSKPIVLSHTSLRDNAGQYSRRISAEHARTVAATGGVIGVWPPQSEFPTLTALAAGMARMVDAVGVDHVGLGSDMRGLVGPSVFPDYDSLPGLAQALLDAGFSPVDAGKVLGGNYVRVLNAVLA